MRIIFSIFIISILCSCATPTMKIPRVHPNQINETRQDMLKLTKEYKYKLYDKIYNINYDITKNASIDLCDKKLHPTLGFSIQQVNIPWKPLLSPLFLPELAQYKNDMRKIYKKDNKKYKIIAIAKNSNAYKAGLRIGDKVVSVYGKKLPKRRYGTKKALKQIVKSSKKKARTYLEIEKDGEIIGVEYENDYVCPYNVYIDSYSKDLNAYADSKKIVLTKRMIEEFYDSPNKLATIIAHELAHNTLGHSHASMRNAMIGFFIGTIIDNNNKSGKYPEDMQAGAFAAGLNLFSKEFEREADYLGTYYVARAGYDYHKSKDTWKKLVIHNPVSLYIEKSHPNTASRYTIIDKTAEEIDNKKAFEMSLLPNFKKRNDYLKRKNKGFFYW